MKNNPIKNLLFAVSLISSAISFADRPPMKPEAVYPPIHRTFIPAGFDTNDNAQVVVTGGYPNSCYLAGHTSYKIDKVTKTIDVTVTAYLMQANFCLQVYTPFQEEISVGILDKGAYHVTVNQQTHTLRDLNVREAPTINPDNHIYAPVSQLIRVGPRDFLLRGTFMSSCMLMEGIEQSYEAGEVLAIFPMVRYQSNCFEDGQPHAWEARFQVRNDLNGEYLIHVRALNGRAVNSVQDFSPFDL